MLIGNQRNARHQRQDQEESVLTNFLHTAVLWGQIEHLDRKSSGQKKVDKMKKGNLKLTFTVVAAILNFERRSRLIQGLELHNL